MHINILSPYILGDSGKEIPSEVSELKEDQDYLLQVSDVPYMYVLAMIIK